MFYLSESHYCIPMNLLKKLFDRLFSTSAAGLYILLFAIAIGVAPFVKNDFGTSCAQKVIFKIRWFKTVKPLAEG
jgi:hypothetical protein